MVSTIMGKNGWPKRRFLDALRGKRVERPPVFCANQTATYDQMIKLGVFWPEAHYRAEDMARLAAGAYTILGFDAVKVPFCQTIEAEALGCPVKPGGRRNLPSIGAHPYQIGDQVKLPKDFLSRGRIPVVIEAMKLLKRHLGDRAVLIGGICGPFSIAASLVGIKELILSCVKAPRSVIPYLAAGEEAGTLLGWAFLEAGADIICIEDMAASLDLINPQIYRTVVLEWHQRQVRRLGADTILHVCGRIDPVLEEVASTGATALSVDTKVDVLSGRTRLYPHRRQVSFIGGIDTIKVLLEGNPALVRQQVRQALAVGYSLVAPSCSLSPGTPTENLVAMSLSAKTVRLKVEGPGE